MSYEPSLVGEPSIVAAALTGGAHGEEADPAVPKTPAETLGRPVATPDQTRTILDL